MGCAMASLSLVAQNSTFLEFQTLIPTASGAKPDLQINFGYLHNIDDQLKWGLGVGISENTSFDFKPSLPVFTRLEFDFTSSGNYRPFLAADLGYSVSFEDFENGSVFVSPMFGVNLYRCYLGVGYSGGMATNENAEWSNCIGIRLGTRFGGSDGAHLHIPEPVKKFFRNTTFGLHAIYGLGLGTATATHEWSGGVYEYECSDLSRYGVGFTWLYDFNDNWAFGLGGTYSRYTYKDEDGDEIRTHNDGDLFLRLQYTMDEIANLPIKPYASVDFGSCIGAQGAEDETPIYYAGQIGIKFWDKLKAGISYSRENAFYGDEYWSADANSLRIVLGVDF